MSRSAQGGKRRRRSNLDQSKRISWLPCAGCHALGAHSINPRTRQHPPTNKQIALPAGVSVSQMSFKPTTGPSPRGPILENGNATWVGVAVRAAKKRKVKLTVDTTGAAPNTPLVFQAWAYRHDGQSPLPCEGSTVTTQVRSYGVW